MTYDHVLQLLNIQSEENGMGDPVHKIVSNRTVLCSLSSIGMKEFYEAAAQGLKPEIRFKINRFEYQGENFVEFENRRYRIIRPYVNYDTPKDISEFESMELICEGVVNNATT